MTQLFLVTAKTYAEPAFDQDVFVQAEDRKEAISLWRDWVQETLTVEPSDDPQVFAVPQVASNDPSMVLGWYAAIKEV